MDKCRLENARRVKKSFRYLQIENSFRHVGGGLAPVLPQLSARLLLRSILPSCSFADLLEVARSHKVLRGMRVYEVRLVNRIRNPKPSKGKLEDHSPLERTVRATETRTIRFIKHCPRLCSVLGGFFRALATQKGARSPQGTC